MSKVQET